MKRRQKLEEMFALQARLNDDTNGPDWRRGVTRQGKVVNWRRCIVMEAAELIDSFSWKHWKSIDGGIDIENIRIELVDIWHFLMSELLRSLSPEEGAELALATMEGSDVKLPQVWRAEENARIDTLLAPYEELMALALQKRDDETHREAMLRTFWRGADAAGLEFDDLYRLYIGKNALNQFRQKHGYKEGRYRKIWRGREDNAVMQEILRESPDIGYEGLMAALERAYIESETA
ncbi:dUTP diphosphatase [Hydrogenimonas sp.]